MLGRATTADLRRESQEGLLEEILGGTLIPGGAPKEVLDLRVMVVPGVAHDDVALHRAGGRPVGIDLEHARPPRIWHHALSNV